MCNIIKSNKEYKEMSLDDIRKVVKNLVKIGAGVVLLTGGEPFLREDLPEIVIFVFPWILWMKKNKIS
jgi:molybdenum cofactor biosynthesis enzyme MoaA